MNKFVCGKNLTYMIFMKNGQLSAQAQQRSIDQFKITFHCFKLPEMSSQLVGFKVNTIYTGRFYNGLYEISVDWGRRKPFLIEKKQFEKYFQRIDYQGSFGT